MCTATASSGGLEMTFGLRERKERGERWEKDKDTKGIIPRQFQLACYVTFITEDRN
jgi:hypothetical protein